MSKNLGDHEKIAVEWINLDYTHFLSQ